MGILAGQCAPICVLAHSYALLHMSAHRCASKTMFARHGAPVLISAQPLCINVHSCSPLCIPEHLCAADCQLCMFLNHCSAARVPAHNCAPMRELCALSCACAYPRAPLCFNMRYNAPFYMSAHARRAPLRKNARCCFYFASCGPAITLHMHARAPLCSRLRNIAHRRSPSCTCAHARTAVHQCALSGGNVRFCASVIIAEHQPTCSRSIVNALRIYAHCSAPMSFI